MRTASRHMPKFIRRSPTGAVWCIAAFLLASMAVVAITHPVVFGGAMAGIFLFVRWQTVRNRRHLRALATLRQGQSICEFARDFSLRDVDSWVVRAVYEQVQGCLRHAHPSFPLRAEDRLAEDLLIDDEEVEMTIAQEVAARAGRSLDSGATNPYFGRVGTVRDLVMFFQHQPKLASAIRPGSL